MPYLYKTQAQIEQHIKTLHAESKKIFVLTDSQVHAHYPCFLENIALKKSILKSGEESKNFTTVESVLKSLMTLNFNRHDVLISFGGGVVGDLGGLCASLYMRGMAHIIVPTTIIAMADSSIGGKTAVNMNGIKNAIGTFYEPSLVLCNTAFLNTLPMEEKQSGMGELLKIALLTGGFCDFNIDRLIKQAVQYKQNIVKEDPFDKGVRHLLNLGHTLGHVVEMHYGLAHGIAVAVGLCYASKISDALGLSSNVLSRVQNLVQSQGLPINEDYPLTQKALNALYHDKKCTQNANLNMVLLEDIGKPKIVSLNIEHITPIIT